jgi:Dolichyl-phosphate-mannose-protein mannosyltransferase
LISALRGLRPWAWFAIAGFILLLAFTFKPSIENDGIGYFSYLHSVVIDHDLDFTDEYAAVRAEHVGYYPLLIESRTATGRLADYFPIGAAVISLPVYLVTLAARPSGDPQFGVPFSVTISLVSLLVGLVALVLSFRLASGVAKPASALIGVVGASAATPFVYYLLYEPSYSHTFSACAVAAFLYVWWRGRDDRSAAGWFALGLLGGLMGLIRYQDGPLLLIGLLDRPRRWWHLLLFFAGALIAFAPQLPVDQVLFGSWLPARPAGQDLQFFPGHYIQVLFSSFHGLFSWTPIVLLAVAGFIFVKDRRLQLAFIYAFVVEVIIGGAAPDWFGGFSFGMRRFVSLTPFFAIGLAALAERVGPKVSWAAVAAFVAWNVVLITNFTYVIKVSGDPGYRQILAGQVKALPLLPHLVSQGAVGRSLFFWPVLHVSFEPVYGLALLLGEVACVGLALLALRLVPSTRVQSR